jgi:hypothetical protein
MHSIPVMKTEQSGSRPGTQALQARFARTWPRRGALNRHVQNWACGIVLAMALPASMAAISQDAPADSPLSGPAHSWAVDCANNEVLVIQHPDSYLRYRLHTDDEKGDRVRDQIETPEGSVARLVQRDGRALTPEEDSAERDRLNSLIASPSTFAQHIRRDQANKKAGVEVLKLMPDAMLWSYTAGQPQLPNRPSGDPALVVLDFKPNPKWSPPSFESEPLTGLEGRVWVDPRSRRLVRLEGNIFRAVNIGWGMVAHIYPGATVTLQQTDAGGQRWIVEHIVEQLTVRALMVKSVKQRLIFDTADFQRVAPMGYQQAIKMLLGTPLPAR